MSARDLWVVVGLGNPGPEYRDTRHNIGFRVVDALVRAWKAVPDPLTGPAAVYRARTGDATVVLVQPTTFMNRSGAALAGLEASREAGPQGHLIVYDDVDLPFGSLRFRRRGGSGGHNGLASILEHFGSQEVPRLRMGIGTENRAESLHDYVLGPFSREETEALGEWVERAVRGIGVFIEDGPEASMNQFNQQKP